MAGVELVFWSNVRYLAMPPLRPLAQLSAHPRAPWMPLEHGFFPGRTRWPTDELIG
jgi:hypothetical protein